MVIAGGTTTYPTRTGQAHGALNTFANQVQGYDESYRMTKNVRGRNRVAEGTTSVQGEAKDEVDTLMVADQKCGR